MTFQIDPDDIRDPQPPTALEEMTEEEIEQAEADEYDEADTKNDEDYYRNWDAKG